MPRARPTSRSRPRRVPRRLPGRRPADQGDPAVDPANQPFGGELRDVAPDGDRRGAQHRGTGQRYASRRRVAGLPTVAGGGRPEAALGASAVATTGLSLVMGTSGERFVRRKLLHGADDSPAGPNAVTSIAEPGRRSPRPSESRGAVLRRGVAAHGAEPGCRPRSSRPTPPSAAAPARPWPSTGLTGDEQVDVGRQGRLAGPECRVVRRRGQVCRWIVR